MNKICFAIILVFIILTAGGNANADIVERTGSSGVNAQVGTLTPTGSVTPTVSPTATPTNIPTATLTPTLAPGTTATPTPRITAGVTISKAPTPTLTSKELYINISGLASPNATIVVTSKDIFVSSVVADSEGFFSLSQLKVDQQNGTVCFDTTDFKRVGSSYVCIPIPNTAEKFEKTGLFLPPTMGLSARKILSKGSAYAFGYSMPKSKITTFISSSKSIESTANDSGYYKVQVKDLPVGTYYLFAKAVYEKQDSQKTDKPLELQSLTPGGLVVEETKDVLQSSFPWIVLIALIIFILLIILFRKRLKKRLERVLPRSNSHSLYSSAKISSTKKPHHDWML